MASPCRRPGRSSERPRSTSSAKTHVLTVRGSLIGGSAPRAAIHVHVYGGATSNYSRMRQLGYATTTGVGAFVFRQHRVTKPAYVYGHVNFYHGQSCTQ